jgi:hypothetical protein
MLSALFASHNFDERINIGSDQLEHVIKRYDPDQLPFAAHDGQSANGMGWHALECLRSILVLMRNDDRRS